jgi:peptidoglycan/LPS O-acetylase OafA/YrhL
MNGRGQILSHTGLRGAAALFVVMYHLGFGAPYLFPIERAVDIFRRSYLFVDFFFLLSGFVLAYVYLGDRRAAFSAAEARAFIIARIARVYPLHLLTLLLLLAFHGALVGMAAGGIIGAPQAMPGGAAQFGAHLLLAQSWGFFKDVGWNIPSWSISTEFAAYLAFPLIVYALIRARRIALASMLAFSIAFYVYIGATTGNLDLTVGVALVRCFAGFFIGVAIYLARDFFNLLGERTLSAIQIAAVAIMLALFELTMNDALLIAPFAALVAATSGDRGAVARALSHPVMTKLGDWSYAVYLLHVPVIHIVGFFFWRTLGRPEALPDPLARILWIALIYAVTIIAARVVYERFEMPARKAIVKRLAKR